METLETLEIFGYKTLETLETLENFEFQTLETLETLETFGFFTLETLETLEKTKDLTQKNFGNFSFQKFGNFWDKNVVWKSFFQKFGNF